MEVTRFELPSDAAAATAVCLAAPLPTTDPAEVRLAARRFAGIAAELRRTGDALTVVPAWTGAAEKAFAVSMSRQTPTLRTAADRYDGYGRALSGYAGALDSLRPRLIRLRADLSPADAAALDRCRQFKAAFDEWAAALDVCCAGLRRTDHASPDRDPHGFAAVLHHVDHVLMAVDPVAFVILHPSLKHLSECLGRLGTELTILGIGLMFLCPPAGAACLTAATVLSGLQLATDVTRRARGEDVPTSTLLLDALGAVPGGHTAEETQKAAQVIEKFPGGGLAAHEGPGLGHTLEKHVGRGNDYLQWRFANERKPKMLSTFWDQRTAEEAIGSLLAEKQSEINTWLSSGLFKLELIGKAPRSVGFVLRRGAHIGRAEKGLRVILYRTPSMSCRYHVRTAMVVPS